MVHRLDVVGQFTGSRPPQYLQRGCRFAAAQPVQHLQPGAFPRAQVDARAEQSAQFHRLRVVVAVDVGHQDVGDVAEVAADGGRGLLQRLARLGYRPAAVDHDEAPVAGQVLQ